MPLEASESMIALTSEEILSSVVGITAQTCELASKYIKIINQILRHLDKAIVGSGNETK